MASASVVLVQFYALILMGRSLFVLERTGLSFYLNRNVFNKNQAGRGARMMLAGKGATKYTAGHRTVKLSMAVACLIPFGGAVIPAGSAQAQMAANCTQKIDFGKFAIGGAGSLTVTPGGSVPAKPSVITVTAAQPGVCKVSGFGNTTGVLSIQISRTQTNMVDGGNAMTIKDFNIDAKNAGHIKTYFSASLTKSTVTYNVGATLHIDGGDPPGNYSGSVMIIHMYTN